MTREKTKNEKENMGFPAILAFITKMKLLFLSHFLGQYLTSGHNSPISTLLTPAEMSP